VAGIDWKDLFLNNTGTKTTRGTTAERVFSHFDLMIVFSMIYMRYPFNLTYPTVQFSSMKNRL